MFTVDIDFWSATRYDTTVTLSIIIRQLKTVNKINDIQYAAHSFGTNHRISYRDKTEKKENHPYKKKERKGPGQKRKKWKLKVHG